MGGKGDGVKESDTGHGARWGGNEEGKGVTPTVGEQAALKGPPSLLTPTFIQMSMSGS